MPEDGKPAGNAATASRDPRGFAEAPAIFDRLAEKSTGNGFAKGSPDPNGDVVEKVYIRTAEFTIYAVEKAARDFARPRYYLHGSNEEAKLLRARLTPLVRDIALVNDVVVVIYRSFMSGKKGTLEWESVRERTLEMTARAMQLAFEGQEAPARELVNRVRHETECRRDSKNRMRYIAANLMALTAMLILWGTLDYGTNYSKLITGIGPRPDVNADRWEAFLMMFRPSETFSMVTAISLGALGAFFAVSLDIKSIKVYHAVSKLEMFYSGFARILIGMIAAGVVVLLFDGKWILSGIQDEVRISSIYLFAFLGGFSEYFVPNALKQAESSAKVAAPDDEGAPAK